MILFSIQSFIHLGNKISNKIVHLLVARKTDSLNTSLESIAFLKIFNCYSFDSLLDKAEGFVLGFQATRG